MPDINVSYGFRGPRGASAYQEWLSLGHTGTEADFVEWCRAKWSDVDVVMGAPDAVAGYDGGVLTIPSGASAYQAWLAQGHTGTEADFITWLRASWTDVSVRTGAPGTQVIYDHADQTLTLPKGDTGAKGDKGDKGDSVVITPVADPAAFAAYSPGPLEIVVLY